MSMSKCFCKVCYDAGKSEYEYKSHYVKSEVGVKGKVCCPTLLSQACTYCQEVGHTVKYCVILKKSKKSKEHAVRVQEYVESNVLVKSKSKSTLSRVNGFDALAQLDAQAEDEEVADKVQLKAYPILCVSSISVNVKPKAQLSYANMVAKSKTDVAVVAAIVMSDLNALALKAKSKAKVKASNALKTPVKPFVKKSWADWSDSDDDDDDDDVCEEECEF